MKIKTINEFKEANESADWKKIKATIDDLMKADNKISHLYHSGKLTIPERDKEREEASKGAFDLKLVDKDGDFVSRTKLAKVYGKELAKKINDYIEDFM